MAGYFSKVWDWVIRAKEKGKPAPSNRGGGQAGKGLQAWAENDPNSSRQDVMRPGESDRIFTPNDVVEAAWGRMEAAIAAGDFNAAVDSWCAVRLLSHEVRPQVVQLAVVLSRALRAKSQKLNELYMLLSLEAMHAVGGLDGHSPPDVANDLAFLASQGVEVNWGTPREQVLSAGRILNGCPPADNDRSGAARTQRLWQAMAIWRTHAPGCTRDALDLIRALRAGGDRSRVVAWCLLRLRVEYCDGRSPIDALQQEQGLLQEWASLDPALLVRFAQYVACRETLLGLQPGTRREQPYVEVPELMRDDPVLMRHLAPLIAAEPQGGGTVRQANGAL
jgi:hypothetical protein